MRDTSFLNLSVESESIWWRVRVWICRRIVPDNAMIIGKGTWKVNEVHEEPDQWIIGIGSIPDEQ